MPAEIDWDGDLVFGEIEADLALPSKEEPAVSADAGYGLGGPPWGIGSPPWGIGDPPRLDSAPPLLNDDWLF